MKCLIGILSLLWSFPLCAQNVGVGNTSPAEKLDVTGNINVTGTIKANGVDGMPNQVLMKNSSGNMEWGDMCSYKNFRSFYNTGNFTIPAGITRVLVEVWGGGGGGNANAGGGGGGYLRAQVNVAAGDVCEVNIGGTGFGTGHANASSGGATYVSVAGGSYNAQGGQGATYVATSRYNHGLGGGFSVSGGSNNYIGVNGMAGDVTSRQYAQVNATTYYEMIRGGNGGFAYNIPSGSGRAPYIVWNMTGGTTIQLDYGNLDAKGAGGGGAGGLTYGSGSTIIGGSGAGGLAIIHY